MTLWDVPTSGRKAKLNKAAKPYKWTMSTNEYQVHIYAMKYMNGIKVMSREELHRRASTSDTSERRDKFVGDSRPVCNPREKDREYWRHIQEDR